MLTYSSVLNKLEILQGFDRKLLKENGFRLLKGRRTGVACKYRIHSWGWDEKYR